MTYLTELAAICNRLITLEQATVQQVLDDEFWHLGTNIDRVQMLIYSAIPDPDDDLRLRLEAAINDVKLDVNLNHNRSNLADHVTRLRLLIHEATERDASKERRGSRRNSRRLSNTRVFIVHGHDNEMKEATARFVEKIGLEAIVLHEKADRGMAVFEKLEEHSDVGFAIVLLSPDDVGYRKTDGTGCARPRARQNVILELGYFIGKLGRDRVVALLRKNGGEIEEPSDYKGILYKSFDSPDWRTEIAREMRECGLDIDLNRLAY